MPDAESIRFCAPGGPTLEGRFLRPDGARGAVVLCHAHPQYGGSMSVLLPVLQRALSAAGWASLRFNFRGVGRSEGTYDHGAGELADAKAALNFAAAALPGAPLAVAGWSFGALIGLSLTAADERVGAYAGIAAPVTWSASGESLPIPAHPVEHARVLFVCGTEDPFCRPKGVRAFADQIAPHAEIQVLDGEDHFFSTGRDKLARRVTAFIADGP